MFEFLQTIDSAEFSDVDQYDHTFEAIEEAIATESLSFSA